MWLLAIVALAMVATAVAIPLAPSISVTLAATLWRPLLLRCPLWSLLPRCLLLRHLAPVHLVVVAVVIALPLLDVVPSRIVLAILRLAFVPDAALVVVLIRAILVVGAILVVRAARVIAL